MCKCSTHTQEPQVSLGDWLVGLLSPKKKRENKGGEQKHRHTYQPRLVHLILPPAYFSWKLEVVALWPQEGAPPHGPCSTVAGGMFRVVDISVLSIFALFPVAGDRIAGLQLLSMEELVSARGMGPEQEDTCALLGSGVEFNADASKKIFQHRSQLLYEH